MIRPKWEVCGRDWRRALSFAAVVGHPRNETMNHGLSSIPEPRNGHRDVDFSIKRSYGVREAEHSYRSLMSAMMWLASPSRL